MLFTVQELQRELSHHSLEVITDTVCHIPAYTTIFTFRIEH